MWSVSQCVRGEMAWLPLQLPVPWHYSFWNTQRCAVCVGCVLFVWVQRFQTLTQLWDLPMSHYGRTQQCCYTIDFD